jgi:sugar phosphate permease
VSTPGPTFPRAIGARLISFFHPARAPTLAERTRRRVTLHLIPWLFCLYILAYLDRVNVAVAGLQMQEPPPRGLGFDTLIVGVGFGIFFWGYWILEIPSTVSVVRWGARWVFVRILILWGICAALVGAIGTPVAAWLLGWLPYGTTPEYQFYYFRFMLGFFEGGFFPSVIVYLSLWFRTEDRAKAIAAFMAAIPIANIIGMPISGVLLHAHWFGLAGWRWIFILEGVVPIVAGVATLFFLPDRPEKARWLSPAERDWLVEELEREHRTKLAAGHGVWVHHLGLVLLLTGVYFCLNVTSYGLGSSIPGIIKSQADVSARTASVLSALPYVMALLGMLVNGRHSDRTGERFWHAAVPLGLVSLGLALASAFYDMPVWPVLALIFVVGTFLYAHLPAFWPMPTMFLGATVAAAAIGFINMVGNLGGSLGSYLVGKAAQDGTGYRTGLLILAPWTLVGAIIVLVVGYSRRRRPGGEGVTVSEAVRDVETTPTAP